MNSSLGKILAVITIIAVIVLLTSLTYVQQLRLAELHGFQESEEDGDGTGTGFKNCALRILVPPRPVSNDCQTTVSQMCEAWRCTKVRPGRCPKFLEYLKLIDTLEGRFRAFAEKYCFCTELCYNRTPTERYHRFKPTPESCNRSCNRDAYESGNITAALEAVTSKWWWEKRVRIKHHHIIKPVVLEECRPDQDFVSSFMPSLPFPRKNIGFTAPLIHRTSPESPFYDPNTKHEDLISNGIRTSLARARVFSKRKSVPSESLMYALSPVAVIGKDFVMSYSIGTPPVQTFGVADTASHVIWLQCQPCVHCYEQSVPFYNYEKPSTFEAIPCGPSCDAYPGAQCNWLTWGACRFHTDDMDRFTSDGYVGTDTITLADNGITGETNLEHMMFGCGTQNTDKGTRFPGVIGLANHTSSLIGQLEYPQFSYYVSTNSSGTYGEIDFGLIATTPGPTTPTYSTAIRIITKHYEGGFTIDTGTTYTVLDAPIFKALRRKIVNSVLDQEPHAFYETDHDIQFGLCYENAPDPPEIELRFANHMAITLCKSNTWIKVTDGQHCLAIVEAHEGMSVLGMYQQRNLRVGFDLGINQVTMEYQNSCPDYIE
ncbi:hypothetical protein RJ640_030280 [Escallonia rubra]|uniref:Peptidase A1 domain-containing protein n=1 Tax=Escallonia rubra TaxID=112253 RepID=A0AA88UGU6_9ASTE|nr:hypothetical protein RJ640_030280 [Escallonia rubra]